MPGRPILYGTTRRFLTLLGLNSLKDLPQGETRPAPSGAGVSPASQKQDADEASAPPNMASAPADETSAAPDVAQPPPAVQPPDAPDQDQPPQS